MDSSHRLMITRLPADISNDGLDDSKWEIAFPVFLSKCWSGKTAEQGRRAAARLLWSETGLYVRFETLRNEPLNVSPKPDLTQKTVGLWDRDVCEIFVAPDSSNRNKYFEFEVAPTGEWIDIAIEFNQGVRIADFEYRSGMTCAARIEDDRVVMAIKIPWEAFGRRPTAGDVWLGNLFRCVGEGETRGYLAWQPTMTEKPNFHVPSKFGEFHFV